ncbi:MAG: phytanoyl-CoA dioxygenase family protein [Planctomycetota bacterium]|nr:phytanoyl-CoA dioxygenase family protein [Planctomycetota bacterium]MDA1140226.1 phytanoyl-CoA dioxygenase family protein [Planctomycetota bacterium]
MITKEQVEQFDTQGAVTIDTPLTSDQLAAARRVFDELLPQADPSSGELRNRVGQTGNIFEQELLDILQSPFLEDVAKKVLRAEAVTFFQTAIIKAYPEPGAEFRFSEHTDIQYCSSDFESIPRRMVCSHFLWLNDVNEKRAPMMHRPGSHLLIARHRQNDPELAKAPPAVKGTSKEHLPDLPYSEPVPVTARAGQVSVLTTSMVHAGSTNVDKEPRYAFVITFHPRNFYIGLPESQAQAKIKYDRELQEHLRSDRRHLIDTTWQG